MAYIAHDEFRVTFLYVLNPFFPISTFGIILRILRDSPCTHADKLHCFADLATPLLLISLTLYSLCLFPTFHHLWLYSGSGNANFFYASTLVWAISQGGILLDFLSAKGRREILEGLGEKGRERVRLGEWKVVQK